MRFRDNTGSRAGLANRLHLSLALPVTQSKTNRPIVVARPGAPSELVAAAVSCAGYTATIGVGLRYVDPLDDIISTCGLDIDAVPEKFKVGAHVIRVGGKFVEKGAATAIVFSAAHVIAEDSWGIILVQEDNAGTITTKVPGSSQTGTQAYTTSDEAIAALPAPTSGKKAIGYILINTEDSGGHGEWTATTDDMTDASDVLTADFVSLPACLPALTGDIAPVAMTRVAGTLGATASYKVRDTVGDKDLVAIVTTDGNAVITNPNLEVVVRGIGGA